MSLEKRYRAYLLLAIVFCVIGIIFNITTKTTTGMGALSIAAGGLTLALGITIKRKARETQKSSNEDISS